MVRGEQPVLSAVSSHGATLAASKIRGKNVRSVTISSYLKEIRKV
jgi:hypothetical protein